MGAIRGGDIYSGVVCAVPRTMWLAPLRFIRKYLCVGEREREYACRTAEGKHLFSN